MINQQLQEQQSELSSLSLRRKRKRTTTTTPTTTSFNCHRHEDDDETTDHDCDSDDDSVIIFTNNSHQRSSNSDSSSTIATTVMSDQQFYDRSAHNDDDSDDFYIFIESDEDQHQTSLITTTTTTTTTTAEAAESTTTLDTLQQPSVVISPPSIFTSRQQHQTTLKTITYHSTISNNNSSSSTGSTISNNNSNNNNNNTNNNTNKNCTTNSVNFNHRDSSMNKNHHSQKSKITSQKKISSSGSSNHGSETSEEDSDESSASSSYSGSETEEVENQHVHRQKKSKKRRKLIEKGDHSSEEKGKRKKKLKKNRKKIPMFDEMWTNDKSREFTQELFELTIYEMFKENMVEFLQAVNIMFEITSQFASFYQKHEVQSQSVCSMNTLVSMTRGIDPSVCKVDDGGSAMSGDAISPSLPLASASSPTEGIPLASMTLETIESELQYYFSVEYLYNTHIRCYLKSSTKHNKQDGEKVERSQLTTKNDIVDFLKCLGFRCSSDRLQLRVPDFFLLPIYFTHLSPNIPSIEKITVKDQILRLRDMLYKTIHTLLLKFHRENKRLYSLFSHLQREPFKPEPPTALKDTILHEMYSVAIDRCRPNQLIVHSSIYMHPIKHFQPGNKVICAVIDQTHTVVYLGFCYRDNSSGKPAFEMDANGRKKKYAVITAYFCNDPVMVDHDRISFHFQSITKLGLNHYAMYWENGEISFEANKEQEWNNYEESQIVTDIDVPEHDPHPLEDYCLDLMKQRQLLSIHATPLFQKILSDMKVPYWRIFCKIPKTSALFDREKNLISEYVEMFKDNTPIHFMIYGLSLLLGRFPDTIKTHLQELGAMVSYSTLIYDDDSNSEKGYDELLDEERAYKIQRKKLVNELRSMLHDKGKIFAANRIIQWNPKGGLEVDNMRKILSSKKDEWSDRIKNSNSYFFQATIAVNGAINDDFDFEDENYDIVDSATSGGKSSLPKSMHKVNNKYYYKFDDISRGYAKYPIAATNSVDQISPGSFIYSLENKIFDKRIQVAMDQSLKEYPQQCNCCSSNSRSGRSSCTNCKCSKKPKTYDADGCLTKQAVDNQTVRIVECGKFCTCDKNLCSNRVLQKGCSTRVELFKTAEKGWGVRTLQSLKRYQFVDEYIGEIVEDEVAEVRGLKYDQVFECSYLFNMTEEEDNRFIIDARKYCNASRWFNHSCDPNMISKQVQVDTNDPLVARIGFFTNKDIPAGTELTFDYQYKTTGHIKCRCNSHNCRGWLM